MIASLLATSSHAADGRYFTQRPRAKNCFAIAAWGQADMESSQRLHLTFGLASRDEPGCSMRLSRMFYEPSQP